MKVTVCFGPVRVVVPCGDGDLLIKDLTRQAIHRYKKAVGKCGGGIVVHSLQSSDGGILDPDDRLQDVADDREHLVAAFDGGGGGGVPAPPLGGPPAFQAPPLPPLGGVHHAGDGASNSSRGTPSPDQMLLTLHNHHHHYNAHPHHQLGVGVDENEEAPLAGGMKTSSIEVTECDLLLDHGGSSLQVRRGSEPALNHLQDNAPNGRAANSNSNAKRWSAAPVITESSKHSNLHKDDYGLSNGHSTDKWREMDVEEEEEEDDDEDEEELMNGGGGGGRGRVGGGSRRRNGWMRGGGGGGGATPFARDGSNRLSMQFLGESPTGLRWADAADKASKAGHSLSLPREARTRKEPLGQANTATTTITTTTQNDHYAERTELICLSTESGALGIHVVPDLGVGGGLVVQAVEEGGRVDRDGRLVRGDRIVAINGRSLIAQPFHVVQDIFRESLRSSELRLRVVKQAGGGGGGKKPPPPPVYPKPQPPSARGGGGGGGGRLEENGLIGGGGGGGGGNKENQINENGPTKEKLTSAKGIKENNQQVRKMPVVGMVGALQTGNTRRMGRKIEVQLVKGLHGLGFSITTRDNPAGGNCPIYIKNILPKGAAVEDGRLRPGDRLLAVDGCELTGKTQAEAVALLRQVPSNHACIITVSRHDPTPAHPPHTSEKDGGNGGGGNSSMEVGSSPTKQQRPADTKSIKSANNSSNQDSNNSGSSVATSHSKRLLTNNDSKNSSNHSSSNQDDDNRLNNDSQHQLWKQREIVTLYIPVHDTEKAGLGVSVKGKTSGGGSLSSSSTSTTPQTDLGIFIKNVLHGGAASRDGRLRTNDQLLSVNGIQLAGLSNQAAMETLRRAMLRTEGPVEGTIVLTVARRIQAAVTSSAAATTSQQASRRGSVSSLLTDSSANTETFGGSSGSGGGGTGGQGGDLQNNSGNSEASDSTVICLPATASGNSQHTSNHSNSTQRSNNDGVLMRNAVLERLTGQTSLPPGMGGLHNESYYRATHQTTLLSLGANQESSGGKLTSPTVNQPARETLIIEDDSSFLPSGGGGDNSLGGLRTAAAAAAAVAAKPGRTDSTSTSSQADATYASQLSLDTGLVTEAGFSRDAFGRQSMSEKRHATLDAKNTDTYRRTKRARELRQAEGGDTDRSQLGPSLGMKKSSSLESLQTMVQEMQMYEDIDRLGVPVNPTSPAGGGGGHPIRVIRGRGCNESFRAAVDRSYDAAAQGVMGAGAVGEMDTVAEDDAGMGVGGHLNRRQTSLDSKLKAKKRQSLLRGLGSMFRFGKHRKNDCDDDEDVVGNEERVVRGVGGGGGGEEGRGGVGGGGGEEGGEYDEHQQQVIQEQLRRLMVAATSTQPSREAGVDIGGGGGRTMMTSSSSGGSLPTPSGDVTGGRSMMTTSSSGGALPSEMTSSGDVTGGQSSSSRTERIQQLRAHHQLRHQERRGHYPLDDTEERYEMALRQRLEHNAADLGLDSAAIHRPGSRVAITDPARFSHYVNYQQIQHHLNMPNRSNDRHPQHQQQHNYVEVRSNQPPPHYASTLSVRILDDDDDDDESRRQQHYHSQRREATSGRGGAGMGDRGGGGSTGGGGHNPRPVSNFYEYESVESHLLSSNSNSSSSSNSLPRRPPPATTTTTTTSSGASRNYQQRPSHHDNYSAVPGLTAAHHLRQQQQQQQRSHQQQQQQQQIMSNNNNILNHHNNNLNSNSYSNNNNNNVRKSHGPFVSHVTIREYQPKV